MWSIRRAAIHLRTRGLSVRYVKSDTARSCFENCDTENIESQGELSDKLICSLRFYNTFNSSESYSGIRTFSSLAGAKNSDNLEDIFPKLQTRQDAIDGAAAADEMDDESVFDSEIFLDDQFADDKQTEFGILETKNNEGEKKSQKIKTPSGMTRAMLADTRLPVSKSLDKWVEAGNKVTPEELSANIIYFRKLRMFSLALQLSEWSESRNHSQFSESMYASRVDLIAKVRGLIEAAKYVQYEIPESFRTEPVYRTLLASCVAAIDVNKAEELFNKMKDLFPLTCFSCDQMLLLYKRTNRNKIADILSLMKKENIKRSIFTYQILIDTKYQSGHITGMERILEEMKSDGVEPSMHILVSVAKYYVSTGLKVKAEALLKDMERGDLSEKRFVCRFLLPVYASLGRADEVGRVWKQCESDPNLAECIAGILAFGGVNRVEDAEAVFDKLLRIVNRPSSKHYAYLLNIYADHKMVTKGENLVTRMTESGVTIMPPVWHALVKLYARAGEIEKGESALRKAVRDRRGMPLLSSFMSMLAAYSAKGDTQNAERIFLKMKRTGFTPTILAYRNLLYAYINAKAVPYGFRERMEADHVAPDKKLAAMLVRAFKYSKPKATDLLP